MVAGCISCWDIFHLSPPMPSAKRPVILTILLGIRLNEEGSVVDQQTAFHRRLTETDWTASVHSSIGRCCLVGSFSKVDSVFEVCLQAAQHLRPSFAVSVRIFEIFLVLSPDALGDLDKS